jgi:hypothetical protein
MLADSSRYLGVSSGKRPDGSVLVRRGNGGRRRQIDMDDWAWEHLEPWLKTRVDYRSDHYVAS